MIKVSESLPTIGSQVLAYSLHDRNENGIIGVRETVIFEGLKDGVWKIESDDEQYLVTDWHIIK